MEETVDLQTPTNFPVIGARPGQSLDEQSLCRASPALNQADPFDLTRTQFIWPS
jgi:hypothetical protein